ncbi:MAG TPA: hypothetical protein DEB74_10890 [Lachnospiraceae bacterium]|nr:hypothetical protein [Lachnospiraceae bacterium]
MTQTKGTVQRTVEFNTLFMNLNEKGQEAALTVLKSLNFAQSVMNLKREENQRNPTKQLV